MTPGTYWQPAVDPSSFRDPSGFAYYEAGEIYRQVNTVYKGEYDHLLSSGLYGDLVSRGLLVPHTEVEMRTPRIQAAYKTLRPKHVGFVSYPYEWCFSQLKDAALTTLEIQEPALHYSMVLKDSSAYNIQFLEGKPMVGTNIGGTKEQIANGVTGFLVSPGDAAHPASSLEVLLTDKDLRRRFGASGRDRFLTLFEFRQFYKKMTSLYRPHLSIK